MRDYTHHVRGAIADFRRHWARNAIPLGLWWLSFAIFSTGLWIRNKFGAPTFDQFLFHVQLGFHGLLHAEYYVIKSFVVSCLVLPAAAAVVVSVGIPLWKKLFFTARAASLFLASVFLLHQVSFFSYAESRIGPDYFSEHYKNPRRVKLTGKNPKNLVLIYVESLDAAYSNTSLFGKDLLHNLDAPSPDSLSFARYSQAPGTGWTMAAIVSTQCGVPLENVTLYDGNAQGEKLNHFLPSAMCLGDVLNKFGYRNIFMGGVSLDFAGKGQFFKDHHYAERYGREEWLAQGETLQDKKDWGLRDDDLFRNAEKELDRLEGAGERFNLTLLTMDTHYPGPPELSAYCAQRGVHDFKGIVECTADQVANFVDYMRQKGYLKNINVVVLGDHLAMTNPVISRLKQAPERHIFNLFVSQNEPRKVREDIVHFDLFPTILDFMGIHVQKGQLALGYSGFSLSASLPHSDRLADMTRNLMHPSPIYFDLWKHSEEPQRS